MSPCTFSHCHSRLLSRRVFAALFVAGFTCYPAWAQETTTQETIIRRGGVTRPYQPSTLSPGYLGQALQPANFHWNARENGVLLSVNIRNDAEPERLTQQNRFGGTVHRQKSELSPGYRLADVAERFDRRIVKAGSVTVLAPALMTMLATRLPAADIYADLSTNEKLRRLQSTLTPAQWRLLGSPAGLGQANLTPAQKKLFASLIPNPFYLTRTRNENGQSVEFDEDSPAPVVLSEAQRRGLHLVVSRELSWWFTKTEPGSNQRGTVFLGVSTPTGPNGTDTFTLREKDYRYHSWDTHEITLFGAAVRMVVPQRAKPTDLDYASAVLDAPVPLLNAKTIGDLIERAQKATGIPIFCDPRYRDLTFVLRAEDNQGVRAGDLIKALAIGVSGTFRRVADKEQAAYVLTDDLEGLGTRQARIAEWAQEAAAQRQNGDAEMENALKNVEIGDYIGWSAGDPLAPTGDLAQRIEDYRAGKNGVRAAQNNPKMEERGLWVPVSELPAPAQTVVKRQIENWNRQVEESQKQGENGSSFYKGLLRTEKVHLDVHPRLAILIPGIGSVNTGSSNSQQDLLATQANRAVSPAFPTQKPRPEVVGQVSVPHWPQVGGTVRALVVPLPETEQAAIEAASVAKSHGFNQLWVKLPLGNGYQERLTQTIKAATSAGLKVQAVAHPTCRLAGDKPDLARDRNLLGETMSLWAKRRAASVAAQGEPNSEATTTMPKDSSYRERAHTRELERRAVGRQKPWGDYLDISDADAQEAIAADVSALMQTPQLAGVVVRDFAPPINTSTQFNFYGSGLRSVVEDFGYTPAQRLRFLQKNGMDPIDLSPLQQGRLPIPDKDGGQSPSPPSIDLPQMPDYGDAAQDYRINGVSASELGAKNALALWKAQRQESAAAAWNRLRSRADTKAAGILLMREPNDISVYESGEPARLSSVGTQDKPTPASVAAPPPGETKKPISPTEPQTAEARAASAKEKWHQRSSTAYLTFRYDPSIKSTAFYWGNEAAEAQAKDPARRFYNTLTTYLSSYTNGGPDGLVIDLSALPLESALPLLRDLPDEPIRLVPDAPPSAKNLPK